MIVETIKKAEGVERNIPFSDVKKKCGANLVCMKMQVRKVKGLKVDEDIMNRRKREAQIDGLDYTSIQEAKEELKEVHKNGTKLKNQEKS